MNKQIKHIPEHATVSSIQSTPSSGFSKIYMKPDKQWYWLDDTGLEVPFKTTLPINAIFVSQYGNDSTAQKYRLDLPYATIAGAKAVASYGDTIYVLPGNYTIYSSILKDGVNYYFCEGTTINSTFSVAPFSDGTEPSSVNCTIRGYLNLFVYFSTNLVQTTKANTYLDIEINNASCWTVATFSVSGNDTKVYFKFNEISENYQYGTYVGDGTNAYLNLKGRKFSQTTYEGTALSAISHTGGIAIDSNIDEIVSSATNAWGPIMLYACNPSTVINHKGKITHTPVYLGFINSVITSHVGGGQINVEGDITTPVSAVGTFGNWTTSDPVKVTIKNSIIRQVGETSNFPIIRSANGGDKIVIMNSRIIGKCTYGLVTTGYTFIYGDAGAGGIIELNNVDLINNYTDSTTPCDMLGISNNTMGAMLVLNKVTSYNNSTVPQYFVNNFNGLTENVKIYHSISNVDNNLSLISNIISGYELVDSQITLLD